MKKWTRRGTAAVLAAFLALESPVGAAGSPAGGMTFGVEALGGELSGGELFDGAAPGGEPFDSAAPGGVTFDGEGFDGEEVLPASPSDGQPAPPKESVTTPSDAKKEQEEREKARKISLVPAGSLRIEMQGVVPGKASTWNVQLLPESDGDPAEAASQERNFADAGSIFLPAVPLLGAAEKGQEEEKEGAAVPGRYAQASLTVEDIPVGVYRLRLVPEEGEDTSYLPYEQKVDIDRNLTTLRLMNGDPRECGYENGAADKFGILAMGDLDGDEKRDDTDRDLLLEMIAKGSGEDFSVYERADLNGDGQADLLDVTAFQRASDLESRQAEPVTSVLIRAGEVIATPSNAEKAEGSAGVEEVFAGTNDAALELRAKDEISAGSPVEITAEFTEPKTMAGLVIDPVPGSGGSITDGEIIVETETGTRTMAVTNGAVTETAAEEPSEERAKVRRTAGGEPLSGTGPEDRGVPIVVDLGGQVPVKKITIRVKKTLKDPKLVEISKVEFYDNMAERIPEPDMAVPERVTVENYSGEFTVRWKNMPNVTGYEVEVTGQTEGAQTATEKFTETAGKCEVEVAKLNGAELVNGTDYAVKVRCVNGEWRSAPAVITARPAASGPPPAPEDLVITPGGRSLRISWKKMKDTERYTLYYKETEAAGTDFLQIPGIGNPSYTLENLKENTEYEIYLKGTNAIGTGPESLHYKVRTVSMNPPVTPNYKLINKAEEGREGTAHITAVEQGSGTVAGGGGTFAAADGRYDTYWLLNDWDAGYYYGNQAPKVTFDTVYEMNTIVLVPDENQTFTLGAGKINYWDESGKKETVSARMSRRTSNGKYYYLFYTLEPIRAKSVQLAVYTYGSGGRIGIAEMKFYHYDSIEKEIMDLYADAYHVSLREEPRVTQDTIDGLRARLEVPDADSGELHPRKAELERELDNAEEILKHGNAGDGIIPIDNKDTTKADAHITFRAGLNTFQPLGVTALAGEKVTVYVGGPGHRDGDNTRLELYMAQYHGSSAAVFKSMGYLKAGANDFTVEAIDQMAQERGGQLYVEYTGDPGAEEYGVRVIGGRKSAFLDLSDVTDHGERVELARHYLEELREQDAQCETLHEQDHEDYDWQPENCVYQATDIVTRYNMVSTAARQVLAGLETAAGDTSTEAMAEQLADSMEALDEMMVLFYQHKGLSEAEDTPGYNRMPAGRINFRYQRMFAGAFMYAGGRHIGIQWPQLTSLMAGHPVKTDADGKYVSGGYFGWGFAHEVGHEINEGAYAVAEVTNNYFSVLAQARDNNETVRFRYEDVFDKVTSGTRGKAANVFVQLAMYWQLHLAYDLGGYNYKIFSTNEEQLANLIFARMDSYVRNPGKAPGAEDNKLTLTGADTDNKLMRLAVAAAQKDNLEFFRRWGLEPDEGTIRYAGQFEKETRGIWFANDDTRAEQLAAGGKDAYANPAGQAEITGSLSYDNENRVTLSLSSSEEIRMYEIYRCERVKSEFIRRPVGYAEAVGGTAEFTDVVGTVNNRAFTYEAVGYDMWLNPTDTKEIGTVKVSHDGALDKTLWTVDTNLRNGSYENANEDHPDTGEQPGLEVMADNRAETSFTGSTPDGKDPEIVLNLNREETVTGVSFLASAGGAPLTDLTVYLSSTGDGGWVKVWEKAENGGEPEVRDDGSRVIHFHDDKKLLTYDASYVRLVAEDMGDKELTVSELSLLGQSGDNVELDEKGIGILEQAYSGSAGAVDIPAGSLVFTGTYKGNPAYNAVLLWDEDGNLVGGTDEEDNIVAEQIIFAPDPGENGKLGEVKDGIWVYYVKQEYVDEYLPAIKSKKVRAELYRVDDAETNAGERLVSSTVFVEVPEDLPRITLQTGGGEP